MSSENEKPARPAHEHMSEEAVSRLDSGSFPEGKDEQDAHIGVKAVEAAEKVYGRHSKWLIILGIALASYTCSLDDQTTNNYLPFAASAYNKHSFISTLQVAQSVIVACGSPVVAKFADLRSRAQAYVLVLMLYVLGYTITACAHGIGSLGAGIILYAIGHTGLEFLNLIIIADITTLKWRGAVASLTSLPYIINAFIGSNVATQVMEHCGWRWGYGMFAIIIPASFAPLILTLLWAERKAKKMGLVPEGTIANGSLPFKAWNFCQQLDMFGLLLMGASVALILLPLTLAINAHGGWHNPSMIAMIVVGCVSLPITALWEIKFAKRPFLARRTLTNRTVTFSFFIEFFESFSSHLTLTYLYSFVLVVKPWSLLDTTYFNKTQSVARVVFSIMCGFAMRWLHGYKLLLVVGLGVRLVGVGLMIHSRGAQGSAAEIVWTQILLGLGGGVSSLCTRVASQASVPHIDMAMTTALLLLWYSIGGAVGGAVAGAIWTNTMPQKLAEYLPNANATYRAELFGSITLVTKLSYDDPVRKGVISAYGDVMKILLIAATVLSAIPFAISFFMPSWYLGDEQNAVETPDLKGELPGTMKTDEGSTRNEKAGSS